MAISAFISLRFVASNQAPLYTTTTAVCSATNFNFPVSISEISSAYRLPPPFPSVPSAQTHTHASHHRSNQVIDNLPASATCGAVCHKWWAEHLGDREEEVSLKPTAEIEKEKQEKTEQSKREKKKDDRKLLNERRSIQNFKIAL